MNRDEIPAALETYRRGADVSHRDPGAFLRVQEAFAARDVLHGGPLQMRLTCFDDLDELLRLFGARDDLRQYLEAGLQLAPDEAWALAEADRLHDACAAEYLPVSAMAPPCPRRAPKTMARSPERGGPHLARRPSGKTSARGNEHSPLRATATAPGSHTRAGREGPP